MSPKTPSQSTDDGELSAIEQVAADWMIQRDHGLTAAQHAELARWLEADERHAAVFKALEATWDLMGEARETPAIASPSAARPWRSLPWIPIGLAAAAAIAGALLWSPALPFSAWSGARYAASATTEIGALRTLHLPDGSVVQLNTDTGVDVQFTPAERRIRLARGEAHFAVAKNPARPFIVTAGDVEMRAVGTAFNVRLRSAAVEVLVTEGAVKVAATEARSGAEGAGSGNPGEGRKGPGAGPDGKPLPGTVEGPAGQNRVDGPPVLTAGHRMVVSLAPAALAQLTIAPPEAAAVEPQVIMQALAWQQRRLDFESTPLPEMVAEINRYNPHKLVIADPRLETQRFGGSFPAGDYDTFVRLLETNFGVVAERKGSETFLRLGR